MKIKKITVLVIIAGITLLTRLYAQEADSFKPGGKPEARVFTSFNSTFADGENHNKFDLTRAYFGYNYNFSKSLSGRVTLDVADPTVGKLQFTGMLKFAYLRFQTDKWTITGGVIPLPEYDLGDKRWGYRYIYKPLHDNYGFGVAADLGLSVGYNFASWLSADVTLMNGEGYKVNEADSVFKVAAGLTAIPVKNLMLRGYFDNMSKNGLDQQTVEAIAAYETKSAGLSFAYNFQKNHGLKSGQDYQGFSVSGNIAINEKIRILGRFDHASSVRIDPADPDPWNISKDGQLYLMGVEFALAPGVHLSPNYQGWNPSALGMPFISRFSLSLDLKM